MAQTRKSTVGRTSHAKEIKALVNDLIEEPQKWLDTENDQLGDEKPRNLLGTPKEMALLNLLHAIKYGMFS